MKRTFLAHHIPFFNEWETCFLYLMEKADTFRIIFQGSKEVLESDAFLNAGKREFLSLPTLTISPYAGMDNSIEVTGELSRAARELFQTFLAPEHPALWSFQLLKGADILLRVDDWTVGELFLEESEIADLLTQGVSFDGEHLEEIDSSSAKASQSDIVVENWSTEELSLVSEQLKRAFLAHHAHVPTPPEDDL
jgi:hypothetical protein